MHKPLRAALELGGTKAICMVGRELNDELQTIEIPTQDPIQTLSEISNFFKSHGEISSLGIGSFGPLQLDSKDYLYGSILNTPKPEWSGVNLNKYFKQELNCSVNIDTDVNAAAIAEAKLGHGGGLENFIYLTIGTGIGGSAFIRGKPLVGLSHSEMGHIQVQIQDDDKSHTSVCPFHSNCIEGLASGKAIHARWGKKLSDLDYSHRAWSLESEYLSDFLMTLCLTISPQRIIIGGGVANKQLLTHLRQNLKEKAGSYIPALRDSDFMDKFIVLPKLGNLAGPYGAFLLSNTNSTFDTKALAS